MKRINYNEKGITLIALVVTIVILLLLAGITLSLIDGENGIISRTKQAVLIHKEAESTENEKIDTLTQLLDSESDSSYTPSQGVNCNCGDSVENLNTKMSQLEEKVNSFLISEDVVAVHKPVILYGTDADTNLTGGWTGNLKTVNPESYHSMTKNKIYLKKGNIVSMAITVWGGNSPKSYSTLGISKESNTTTLDQSVDFNCTSGTTANNNRTISITVETEGYYNIVVNLTGTCTVGTVQYY